MSSYEQSPSCIIALESRPNVVLRWIPVTAKIAFVGGGSLLCSKVPIIDPCIADAQQRADSVVEILGKGG
jgi:hypothetical protein